MGMFAAQDIDIGEVIVAERPLIVAVGHMRQSPYPFHHPWELQRMVAERLTGKNREEFFALHNCKGYTRPHVTGIMDTNAVGFRLGMSDYDAECQAVCKDISRANHSCSPNAMWSWRLEAFALEFRATWPIKKGEQVYARYSDIYEPREKRQKYLLERYKFKCICPSCTSDTSLSDRLRAMLKAASEANRCGDDSALLQWIKNPTLPDDKILVQCRFMISICDEERFYDGDTWPVWFERIVKAYCALEDEEKARMWAEKAAKLSKIGVGHDAGWGDVAKDPKNTNWWGLRSQTRSGVRLFQSLDDFQIRDVLQGQGPRGLGAILPQFAST
ncbi:hypothetical protein QCA50_013406 [Cerrena zonata]|uniref:SET domain-containing protein n=1 Tax=Cerrena zonata TaxID=2478898 RepID=A0AAW0G0X9_9APHY